jgi:hypothetical protein
MVARLVGACTLLLGIGLLLAWPSGAEPSAPASAPASTAPASPEVTDSTTASAVPTPTVIDDSGMTSSINATPKAVRNSRTRTSDAPPSYGIGDAISTSRAAPSYGIGDAVSTSRAVPSLGTDASSATRRVNKHITSRSTAVIGPQAAEPTTHRAGTDGVARTGRSVVGLIATGLLLTATGALVYVAARRSRKAGAR